MIGMEGKAEGDYIYEGCGLWYSRDEGLEVSIWWVLHQST